MTKEHPILFSADMVRAILDGRKTVTRSVIKKTPNKYPYGKPTDRRLLWVRETWGIFDVDSEEDIAIGYKADSTEKCINWCKNKAQFIKDYKLGKWRSSRFMPKWAARIWLEIVNVRAERLHEITEDDAIAEGIQLYEYGTEYDKDYGGREKNMSYSVGYGTVRLALSVMPNKASGGFQRLWNSLNAKRGYGWDKNPWVWRIKFKI